MNESGGFLFYGQGYYSAADAVTHTTSARSPGVTGPVLDEARNFYAAFLRTDCASLHRAGRLHNELCLPACRVRDNNKIVNFQKESFFCVDICLKDAS